MDLNVDLQSLYPKTFRIWLALFLGYCIFCFNWLIFSKMKGSSSNGWSQNFTQISSGIGEEAVNYSITFSRGIFACSGGWLISRIGYRKACLLACLLACTCVPLIFSPHWTILILGRIVMAAGGTLTIVFISPLLAKMCPDEKKKKLSALNGFTFTIAGLVVNSVFLITSVKTFLTKNWQWSSSVAAITSIIPLVLTYLYCQEVRFDEYTSSSKATTSSIGYREVLNKKESWNWIVLYSSLLVVSILTSSFVPNIISEKIENLKNSISGVDWSSLYGVIFFIGTTIGLWSSRPLNTQRIQRTKFFIWCTKLVLLSITMIFLFSWFSSQSWTPQLLNTIVIYINAFWLAFFGLGTQSVLLYIPLEYRDYDPSKTSIFYSCLWGIGYMIVTVYYIISSALKTASTEAALGFIYILLILYCYLSTKLRESRPDYCDWWSFVKIQWIRRWRLHFQFRFMKFNQVELFTHIQNHAKAQ